MRYTTIIDIAEFPSIYRNANVRLIYLHLCLKAGYHDNDRDICQTSFRSLAADTGLTVSACRHAVSTLETTGLLERKDGLWRVKKWIAESTITKRRKPKTENQEAQERARTAATEARERERQEFEQRYEGKTPYMLLFEMKQQKAEQGDPEAVQWCRKNRAMYEEQLRKWEEEKNNGR